MTKSPAQSLSGLSDKREQTAARPWSRGSRQGGESVTALLDYKKQRNPVDGDHCALEQLPRAGALQWKRHKLLRATRRTQGRGLLPARKHFKRGGGGWRRQRRRRRVKMK